jgi:hypothetical protein
MGAGDHHDGPVGLLRHLAPRGSRPGLRHGRHQTMPGLAV